MLYFLYRRRDQPFQGKLFFALLLQTVTSSLVWISFTPITVEFLPAETAAWAFLLPMLPTNAWDEPVQAVCTERELKWFR